MKKLITIALLLLYGVTAKSQCAKIDIVILVDMSGSVSGNEYIIQNALSSFIKGLDLDENGIKISIITFNDNANILHGLSSNQQTLLRSISYIKYGMAEGTTYMDNGFVRVADEFVKNGRIEAKKVVIVLSDGSPAIPYMALAELNNLKSLFSPVIFGILIITGETNEPFMKTISSEGCYLETKWELLVQELSKLNMCL